MNAGNIQNKEPSLSFSAFFPGQDAHGNPDRTALQGISIKRCKAPWSRIVSLLDQPQVAKEKNALPLIKLAQFGNQPSSGGSYRHDENMLEVWGVEGDYDGGEVPIGQAAALLRDAGIAAYLYTTPSHTLERPRWRVLSPLSASCSRAERARFVAKLNGVLGGILARESFTPSQAFFMGKVKGVDYQSVAVDGAPLDQVETRTGLIYPDAGTKGTQNVSPLSSVPEFARELVIDRVTEETLSELRSALGVNPATSKPYIDPDDRVTWVAMAHALKCLGDDGRELWLTWSAHSLKFEDGVSDPGKVWDGCDGTRSDFRAVFTKASAGGWLNPKSAEAIMANATAATRIDRTDAGNVALLHNLVGGCLRWVPESKSWLWWTGERWEPDTGPLATGAALQVGEHYIKEAAKLLKQSKADSLDDKERSYLEKAAKGVRAWGERCRNKTGIDSMLGLAKMDARFVLSSVELDRDPELFGVANGAVDLRTGMLRDVSRDEFVTRRSKVAFSRGAPAPRWRQFIAEITATPLPGGGHKPRPELAAYLQKMLGYCITGSVAEQKMFIAVGEGSNGKSVLVDMLAEVLGSYCQTIPPNALMASTSKYGADAERATPIASMLPGARTACSSESKAGQQLDAALVKQHTGDARMTARALHSAPVTFDITHKLILLTNHKPKMDHLDGAVRGRLHMIPFDMRWNRPGHPERDPSLPDGDKSLMQTLKSEAQGILAWLVEGAVAYHTDGLVPPAAVVDMTRDYFKEQDAFQMWMDTCKRCDLKSGDYAMRLFNAYGKWCADNGYEQTLNQTTFGKRMGEAKVDSIKGDMGRRYALQAIEGVSHAVDDPLST